MSGAQSITGDEPKSQNTLEMDTIQALACYSEDNGPARMGQLLAKFAGPLKDNFENKNLWLRLGLTLSLAGQDYAQSAQQAFKECLRVDHNDPVPAMLLAKLHIKDLNEPEEGIKVINEAINRCRKTEYKSRHKSTEQMLARCYLLSSIMHAHIYDREIGSIKPTKVSYLQTSQDLLNLATMICKNDHLVYFHKALHDARQKSYSSAITNLRRAIQLNPRHVPSIRLLILSLSAKKMYDDALALSDSALVEFEDDLMLLYIKCSLEQNVAESKGIKLALNTAQQILKCVRKKTASNMESFNSDKDGLRENSLSSASLLEAARQTNNLFADDTIQTDQVNLFSSELSVWLLVAQIFIKNGSLADAEQCIDEGSSHASGALTHQIMFVRGLVAKAKNNLIEAKSFFQSCLAMNPGHAEALQQLAHVHYLLGNYCTAEKYLKDAIDVNADCPLSWQYLSLIYLETNQHDKASECVKKSNLIEETATVVPLSIISRLTFD